MPDGQTFTDVQPLEQSFTNVQPIAPLPKIKMETSIVPQLVRGVTGSLPAAGAVAGGALASPTGPGAAAGAGIGTGLGIEAKQLLNRALFGSGEPSTTSPEGLKELAVGSGEAALTAGALQGGANLLTKAPVAANQDVQELNKAIGATQKSVRLGKGATELSDAATMPGRGLANAGFDVDTLNGMTPVEKMAAVAPHYKAAGKAIDLAINDATQAGKTVDVGKSAFDTLSNVKNPAIQDKMIDEFNDVAREVGIADQRTATPAQARALRQALGPSANFATGARYGTLGSVRAQLYGSVSSDLHDAVPGLKDLDQHYSDMRSAMDAAQRGAIKSAITPAEEEPSTLQKVGQAAVKYVVPPAVAATGMRYGMPAYRALKDLVSPP
jgi:hypothetical protein